MLGKLNSNEQTNSIVHPRYGCAIGAAYSVSAIPRGIPIVHCGPGCVDKQYYMLSFNFYARGLNPPSLDGISF